MADRGAESHRLYRLRGLQDGRQEAAGRGQNQCLLQGRRLLPDFRPDGTLESRAPTMDSEPGKVEVGIHQSTWAWKDGRLVITPNAGAGQAQAVDVSLSGGKLVMEYEVKTSIEGVGYADLDFRVTSVRE